MERREHYADTDCWRRPTYDTENRLIGVSGPSTASFVYDADGGRVKATFGSSSTIYVGSHYEKVNGTVVKYYYAGGRRIAMRTGGVTYYLFPDHLASTHVTASSVNGAELGKLLYKPWGETRFTTGTTLTTRRFTGQREDATIGLYYYNARFYDPALGRFTQPDTIVPNPGDPQSLNRYSYTLNNPINYTDPSGHAQACADGDEGGGCGYGAGTSQIWQLFAGQQSPLAEYYATLHELTLAQASGASAIEVEALAGAAEVAYSVGSAWLPQHQLDPTVVVEPASLVSIGGAITSGGMRALGGAISRLPGAWLDYVPTKYRSSVADAFSGEPVASVTATDMVVYRHWGGGADETGSPWFSPKPYVRPGNAQRYLALPPKNSAQNVSAFTIPSGTTVIVGKVAPQTDYFGPQATGGGTQIYLPNPGEAILLGPLNVTAP